MIDEEAQNGQEISHCGFRITDFGMPISEWGISQVIDRSPFTIHLLRFDELTNFLICSLNDLTKSPAP